jgi:MFS family permease
MTARDPTVRNVVLLACCQALSMSAMSISMTLTALVGQSLAADPALSTLPLALQFTATMLTTLPASLLMRRVGRQMGFSIGVVIGVGGALLSTLMIFERSFVGFCLGSILMGCFMGFSVFYRHAAADTASASFRSKAISLVMAGGVVSALLGPELAKQSYDLFDIDGVGTVTYAGCFVVAAALQASILIFLKFVEIPREPIEKQQDTGRPLKQIIRQPRFVVAAAGAMIGYGVMSFVMTATPLAIIACGFVFTDSAFVIQWHAFAMFAPSFFTGSLIGRFGVLRIMLIGAVALIGCVAFTVSGIELYQFWWGLVLLGIGWNFLFIGGTTLLGECHTAAERAKVQGLNDFMVFSTVTVASFSAGAIFHHFGWIEVNLSVLPLIAIVIILLLWMMRQMRPVAAVEEQ